MEYSDFGSTYTNVEETTVDITLYRVYSLCFLWARGRGGVGEGEGRGWRWGGEGWGGGGTKVFTSVYFVVFGFFLQRVFANFPDWIRNREL